MCNALEDIATTSFVGETDSEKGFEGSEMVTGWKVPPPAEWTCNVESQAAEMTRACSLL